MHGDRLGVVHNIEVFRKKTLPLMRKNPKLSAEQKDFCDGVSFRSLFACVQIEIISKSEMEGSEFGPHFPSGFVFDPSRTADSFLIPPRDPCEPAYPILRLTMEEAQARAHMDMTGHCKMGQDVAGCSRSWCNVAGCGRMW